VVIVKPHVGLSTPAVFGALDLSATSGSDPLALLALHTEEGADGHPDKFVNDLEAPAFACIPGLARLKRLLAAPAPEGCGFPVVGLSGSGTSLFCLGEPVAARVNWREVLGHAQHCGNLPWPVHVFEAAFVNRQPGSWYTSADATTSGASL
jgi:4-diphosphocytidyl-2-C-methyl-D-erythritol kinase